MKMEFTRSELEKLMNDHLKEKYNIISPVEYTIFTTGKGVDTQLERLEIRVIE